MARCLVDMNRTISLSFLSASLVLACGGQTKDDADESVCVDPVGEESDSGSCEQGWFLYSGRGCEAPEDGGTCWEVGDGLCYLACESDDDCPGPCAKHCIEFELYDGGDSPTYVAGCSAE